MSQSRIHDLILLLGGALAMPACTERPNDPGDESGVTPEEEEALDEAIELCKPYGRKIAGCYAEADPGEPPGYVAMVGYCVASFGYASSDVPECGDAMADYFACITALDCDVLIGAEDDSAEPGGEEPEVYPCEPEENALDDACDWGEVVDSEPSSDSG